LLHGAGGLLRYECRAFSPINSPLACGTLMSRRIKAFFFNKLQLTGDRHRSPATDIHASRTHARSYYPFTDANTRRKRQKRPKNGNSVIISVSAAPRTTSATVCL